MKVLGYLSLAGLAILMIGPFVAWFLVPRMIKMIICLFTGIWVIVKLIDVLNGLFLHDIQTTVGKYIEGFNAYSFIAGLLLSAILFLTTVKEGK